AMLYIMPLFSFWISFSFPAGLGLYWTLSSIYSLIQTVALNKIYTPERVEKMDAGKKKKKKKKPSMYERALQAQQMQQGGGTVNTNGSRATVIYDDDGNEKKMSKEERRAYDRQKIAEARKRMAEKYGDEYEEFLDD
ncbi:MAG: YidC/Oxa1 family membrane protein insertase, partial [Ruminococcus sp.]|nr:YidC/Oxa1 family membrane protein insertase [Ruminococcus sp.]